MKKCNYCNEMKHKDQFYRGYGTCKKCCSDKQKDYQLKPEVKVRHYINYINYQAKYYNKNRDRLKQRKREHGQKLKLEIMNHYGGKCACCGTNYIEFLNIDHINGDGAQHRKEIKGSSKIYRWLKKNNYPKGFQVLCFNCNCSIGLFSYCPHLLK